MKTIKLRGEYWNSDNLLFPPQQCTFQRGQLFHMGSHFYISAFLHFPISLPYSWLPYQNSNWRKVELLAKGEKWFQQGRGDPDPSSTGNSNHNHRSISKQISKRYIFLFWHQLMGGYTLTCVAQVGLDQAGEAIESFEVNGVCLAFRAPASKKKLQKERRRMGSSYNPNTSDENLSRLHHHHHHHPHHTCHHHQNHHDLHHHHHHPHLHHPHHLIIIIITVEKNGCNGTNPTGKN